MLRQIRACARLTPGLYHQGRVGAGCRPGQGHARHGPRRVPQPVPGDRAQAGTCRALTQFNGEVMDARITNVNKVGRAAHPQMGFFAEVGPLSIFVSSHLLPIDYKFQPDANPPEFTSPTDVRLVANDRTSSRAAACACASSVRVSTPTRLYVAPPHPVRDRHDERRLSRPLRLAWPPQLPPPPRRWSIPPPGAAHSKHVACHAAPLIAS